MESRRHESRETCFTKTMDTKMNNRGKVPLCQRVFIFFLVYADECVNYFWPRLRRFLDWEYLEPRPQWRPVISAMTFL